MTSAELKGLLRDMPTIERKDVLFAHVLIGMVVALENIREEMITRMPVIPIEAGPVYDDRVEEELNV
jgi:hypothetical protein